MTSMQADMTRSELNWREHAIRLRARTLKRLTLEEARELLALDEVRKERGWDDEARSSALGWER
jgi:hypothetical protein